MELVIRGRQISETDLRLIRGLIADPEWPRKVREGRLDEIVECVRCDEGCFGNLRAGVPIACTQWRT